MEWSRFFAWGTTYKAEPLADGGGGELLDHGEQKLAVAFIQIGRVAADLGQEAQFFIGELLGIELVAEGVVGEELGNGQVQCQRDLGQSVERGHSVSVFHAREVAAQQTGFLFNIPLGQALLQPVSANGCADLHGGLRVLSAAAARGYLLGSNQMSIGFIVNMRGGRMQ
jgi:hypothetical protein